MWRTPGACPEYQTKADMSHGDWAPEVNHACFIKSPQSVVGLHTPGDLWREEAADYSALQFSCSRLSCNVNSQEMNKLERRWTNWRRDQGLLVSPPRSGKGVL